MPPTNNNLKLAFAALGDSVLDVRHFSVHEAMNELFEVSVLATSHDDDLDLDAIVGKGAAFKLETGNYKAGTPTRVWAGVVAHMSPSSPPVAMIQSESSPAAPLNAGFDA